MKKCPKTLDKPILLLGLEIEDIAFLLLTVNLIGIFLSPYLWLILVPGGWILLTVLKKDKPEGFALHLLYKWGVVMKGLLPPPGKILRYCAYHQDTMRRKQLL